MDNDTSEFNPLEQNCNDDLPLSACKFGNGCGLFTTALWFIFLLLPVWKNFQRKSVTGISFLWALWATAIFTASIVNMFFVFMYASIPLYVQIYSVHRLVFEGLILIQFGAFGQYRMLHKVLYLCACVVVWGTLIAVELLVSIQNTAEYMAMIAWCIETFPQVILNMKLQTTRSQSLYSVTVAIVGKTIDFVTINVLVLPLQYMIFVYFTTFLVYVNGLQAAWYYGNDHQSQADQSQNSETGQPDDSPATDGSDGSCLAKCGFKRLYTYADQIRVSVLTWLCLLQIAGIVAYIWNTHDGTIIASPPIIAVVLVVARVFICFSRL